MTLPSPNLDDRNFNDLVSAAHDWIQQNAPGWTDLSPSDPGMVLTEVFAYLTDIMIYRLNRVPEKAYIEFLRLMGLTLRPPSAAGVMLRFTLAKPAERAMTIPRGTRVTVNRAGGGREPPVFVTSASLAIDAGASQADVLAHHCELVEGELAGTGTGRPGQSVTAAKPPIVAPTGQELDLVVATEARAAELSGQAPAIQFRGGSYRIWAETDSFMETGPEDFVYVVDRMTGVITFAPGVRLPGADGSLAETPAAMAAVPASGREIRLWYRRGGGAEGNVAADTLTVLKDTIPGAQVTNPDAATGGRPAETLENALIRGPQQLHAVERAVTAEDYEVVALRSSGAISRARAFTRAELWRHALPGTVEVVLVPYLSEEEQGPGRVPAEVIQQHQTKEARDQIQSALDRRRPLGTTALVNWSRYKTVKVKATVVVRREENLEAVKQRVDQRLYQTITPIPTTLNPAGWRFGQPLRRSDVDRAVLREPGVRYVDPVRLVVEQVPSQLVGAVAADAFQPRTWYAGSDAMLFRSLNDGEGWELAAEFAGEKIKRVRTHPGRAGAVVVATLLPDGKSSRIHVSLDCGERWDANAPTLAFRVEDVAWTLRDGVPILLIASDVGLYQLPWEAGGTPVQILVTPEDMDRGFYAVAVATDVQGQVSVAVAAQGTGGVYLSSTGGAPNSFRPIGLPGEDIRVLQVQRDGPQFFLWAGAAVAGGDDPGKGAFRWELRGAADPPEGWVAFGGNWKAGSCWALAFRGTLVLAASHHGGVLRLDAAKQSPSWETVGINAGLPLRDPGTFLFLQMNDVAVDPDARLIIAGTDRGVYRSDDGGVNYASASNSEFLEAVTLPSTWLFLSDEHDITVVSEDEANRT